MANRTVVGFVNISDVLEHIHEVHETHHITIHH